MGKTDPAIRSLLSSSNSRSSQDEEYSTVYLQRKTRESKQKNRNAILKYIPSASRFILISLALYGYISLCLTVAHSLFPSMHGNGPQALSDASEWNEDCDCGATVAEAKARGCIYDALASAWLPAFCRDDELTAEFNRSGPLEGGLWPYFADAKGEIPITTEEVAAMGDTLEFWYSTKEWHVVHCNFYWRKRFRMRETGKLMERRNDQIKHVRHCGDVVLDPAPMDTIAVKAQVVLISADE